MNQWLAFTTGLMWCAEALTSAHYPEGTTRGQALLKRLCMLCLTPITDIFTGTCIMRTTKDGRRVPTAVEGRIHIGSLVKWWEEVEESYYGQTVVKLVAKVMPMSLAGLGCADCQHLMWKAEQNASGDYLSANLSFDAAMRDGSRRAYVMAAGKTPTKRQAYIDVMTDVGHVELPPMPECTRS